MKLCTFEGCERKHSAKGFCKVHYNMWKLDHPLHVIGAPGGRKKNEIIRLCNIEGCGKKHEAKGFCKQHWSKQHYKRLGNRQIKGANTCSVDGCKNPYRAKGYCEKHYFRMRIHGTTELLPKKTPTKICKYPECERKKYISGYCCKHHREVLLQIPLKKRGGHNKKPKQKCEVDNCDNQATTKGWCSKHYVRYKRHGDPLTCYRRPRKSDYVSVDNIMKQKGTYSRRDDQEVLRETFGEFYDDMGNNAFRIDY